MKSFLFGIVMIFGVSAAANDFFVTSVASDSRVENCASFRLFSELSVEGNTPEEVLLSLLTASSPEATVLTFVVAVRTPAVLKIKNSQVVLAGNAYKNFDVVAPGYEVVGDSLSLPGHGFVSMQISLTTAGFCNLGIEPQGPYMHVSKEDILSKILPLYLE